MYSTSGSHMPKQFSNSKFPLRTFAFKITDGYSASLTLNLIQNDSFFLLLVLSYKVSDYPALCCQSNGHSLPRTQRNRKPHTAGPVWGPSDPLSELCRGRAVCLSRDTSTLQRRNEPRSPCLVGSGAVWRH